MAGALSRGVLVFACALAVTAIVIGMVAAWAARRERDARRRRAALLAVEQATDGEVAIGGAYSTKAAELLQLAAAQFERGQLEAARLLYTEIVEDHTGTTQAAIAHRRLAGLFDEQT